MPPLRWFPATSIVSTAEISQINSTHFHTVFFYSLWTIKFLLPSRTSYKLLLCSSMEVRNSSCWFVVHPLIENNIIGYAILSKPPLCIVLSCFRCDGKKFFIAFIVPQARHLHFPDVQVGELMYRNYPDTLHGFCYADDQPCSKKNVPLNQKTSCIRALA